MKNLNTRLQVRKIYTAFMLIALMAFGVNTTNAQTYVGGSATISAVGAPTALPYPLTLDVDAVGVIASVTATVTITHTWPDDLEILLVSPTGAKTLMMSDAGGSGDVVALVVGFDQAAAGFIPDAGPLGVGPYKPTNIGTGDVLEAPAPVGPHSSTMDDFIGTDPFGTWSLYVDDDASGDGGSIDSWSITIVLAAPCTDPPTAGTTLLSLSEICAGGSVTASLSGGTTGDGQTYQWQSSPDGVSYSDIGGATGTSYLATPASMTYYQCVVTCGASSDISDPASVDVNSTPVGNTSGTAIEIASLPFEADGDNLAVNCWTNTIGAAAPDVWYSYTADCDGAIDIDLCTDTWDSYLRIYDASLVSIGGDDDTEPAGCYTFASSVDDFAVTSGTTYYIVVDAFSTGEGTYTLSVNPIDITPSGDVTVCYGEVVTLDATAGYDTYQWMKNGIDLPAATSSSLETKKPGYYQVKTTSGTCEMISDIQAIAVLPSPSINIKAAGGNTDLCVGPVGLKVSSASYDGGIQWYLNGVAIDGATGSTYMPTEAGDYTCVASNVNDCTTESVIISVGASCRLGQIIHKGDLNIYPNPAHNEVFVQATFNNESDGSAEVSLYNALGQMVYNSTVALSSGFVNESISLQDISAGIYTAVIRSADESYTSQLVINK